MKTEREMLESLISKAKSFVSKHGPEVGAVAKIAARALVPGTPLIVGSVEALSVEDERVVAIFVCLGTVRLMT